MLVLNDEPHETGCFYFKFKHYLQACTTSGKKFLMFYAKHPMENYRGSTPHEMPHWMKGYLYWWHFEWCSWISLCFHRNQTIDRSRLVWDLVECTGRVLQFLNLELPINLWWCFWIVYCTGTSQRLWKTSIALKAWYTFQMILVMCVCVCVCVCFLLLFYFYFYFYFYF